MRHRREPLRVIVCGGRDYADAEAVWRVLSEIDDTEGVATVAHGGATGADSEAGEWVCNVTTGECVALRPKLNMNE